MQVAKRILIWSLVLAAFLAASLLAAEKPQPATVVLAADTRLTAPVSLAQRYCTIGEALALLCRETRVKLQAEAPLADENVLLLIKERPAGEVLDLLASQFGYYWALVRNGKEKGYELRQPRPAREQEAKLRAQDLRAAFADLEQELTTQRRFSKLSTDELYNRRHELRVAEENDRLPEVERTRAKAERDQIDNCMFLGLGPKSDLLLGLTPSQRQRLFEGQRIIFSAAGEPHMERMPAAIAKAFLADTSDEAIERYRTHPPRDVRADIGLRVLPSRQLEFRGRSQIVELPRSGDKARPGSLLRVAGKLPAADAPADPEMREQQDPRLNELIQVTLPRKVPVLEDPSTYIDHITLPDILAGISEQAPTLSFISDCTLADLAAPTTKPKRVAEIISAVSAQAGARWQFDPRGYVVLRSRFVYRNRIEAIPAAVLRHFAEAAQPNGGLSMREYARFAAALTDTQMNALTPQKRLLSMFALLQINTYVSFSSAGELRILASLQEPELRALESGKQLPVQSLGLASRTAVAQAVERHSAFDGRIPIEPVELLLPQLALRLEVGPAKSNPAPPGQLAYELEIVVPGQEPLLSSQFEAMPEVPKVQSPQRPK